MQAAAVAAAFFTPHPAACRVDYGDVVAAIDGGVDGQRFALFQGIWEKGKRDGFDLGDGHDGGVDHCEGVFAGQENAIEIAVGVGSVPSRDALPGGAAVVAVHKHYGVQLVGELVEAVVEVVGARIAEAAADAGGIVEVAVDDPVAPCGADHPFDGVEAVGTAPMVLHADGRRTAHAVG